MRIVQPSARIESPVDGAAMLKRLELAGRVCYKSEDKITEESARKFVMARIKSGHESVIEHESVTVRFICDRGVSHELVRHRIASFSQESTRYCNYGQAGEIAVICPFPIHSPEYMHWLWAIETAERVYLTLIDRGVSPQLARSVLPNSLKTEVVMTANLREWRCIFKQRTAPAAHPQMRELMIPLLREFQSKIPGVFEDIGA